MSTTAFILCIVILCLCLGLSIFWLLQSVIGFLDDRESKKRNAKWEEEKQQLEKERAIRDAEYHTVRMKKLKSK